MLITTADLTHLQAQVSSVKVRADTLGKDIVALQESVDAAVLKSGTTVAGLPAAPAGYPALFFSDDFVAGDYPGGFPAMSTGKWRMTNPDGSAVSPYNSAQSWTTDTFSLVNGPLGESLLRITGQKTPVLKSGLICSTPFQNFKLANGPFWLEAKLKHPADQGIMPIFGLTANGAYKVNEIFWIGSGAPAFLDNSDTLVPPKKYLVLESIANGADLRDNTFKSGVRTFTGTPTDPALNIVAGIPSIADGTTTFYVVSIEWTGTKFVGYYNRQRVWEWDLNGVQDPTNQKSSIGSIPRDDVQGMALVMGLFLNGATFMPTFVGNISGAIQASWSLDVDYIAVWKPSVILQKPIANDDSYTTALNTPFTTTAANGVLANDVDPNGGQLSVTRWDAATAGGGTVSATGADGHFTYTPQNGFTGNDSFTYDVVSSLFLGQTSPGIVRVGVAGAATDPLLGTAVTTGSGNTYKLVAHDEFHGKPPVTPHNGVPLYYDQTIWSPTFWQGTSERTLLGNGEAEYYFDIDYGGADGRTWNGTANHNSDNGPLGAANAPVAPGVYNPFSFTPDPAGVLRISTMPIAGGDLANFWAGPGRPYCSGLLSTHPDIHASTRPYDKNADGVTLTNGGWRVSPPYYVEIRCKLPRNFGSWCAFWILTSSVPDNYTFTAPSSDYWGRVTELANAGFYNWGTTEGEIDFFEYFGHRPTKHSYGTICATGQPRVFQIIDEGIDLSLDFHKWGAEVRLDTTFLYLDGRQFAAFPTQPCFTGTHQHYVLLNMAAGGNWFMQETLASSVDAVDTSSFPWHYDLDYARLSK